MLLCCIPGLARKRKRITPIGDKDENKASLSASMRQAIKASAPIYTLSDDEGPSLFNQKLQDYQNANLCPNQKSKSASFLPQDGSQRVRVFSNSVCNASFASRTMDKDKDLDKDKIPGGSLIKSFSTNFLADKEIVNQVKQLSIYIVTWNMNGKVAELAEIH
jgi:hypothetical protein